MTQANPIASEELERLIERLRAQEDYLDDDAADWLEALRKERDDLREQLARRDEALQEARDTFDDYADLHAAKHSSDGDVKARRNSELAARMEAALQPSGEAQ